MEWGKTKHLRIDRQLAVWLLAGAFVGLVIGGFGAWRDSEGHPSKARTSVADNF